MNAFWYYLLGVLFVLCNLGALVATILMLPGNWIIVAQCVLFKLFVNLPDERGLSWYCVGAVVVLAIVGEILEFAAGAAGAARSGGSRRGMLLAIIVGMGGALVGTAAGSFLIPIPFVGTVVGAVGGGALGAFGGAYLGETWKGRSEQERMAISQAALVGRLFGTVGKLAAGSIMVVISALDVFVN